MQFYIIYNLAKLIAVTASLPRHAGRFWQIINIMMRSITFMYYEVHILMSGMKALLILLLALCLAAAVQAAAIPEKMQDVGGDYGRDWLEGRTAGGSEPAEEDDLFSWGEGPKGNPLASRYAANEPSRDWLDAERMSDASNASANNSTSNNTTNEYHRFI